MRHAYYLTCESLLCISLRLMTPRSCKRPHGGCLRQTRLRRAAVRLQLTPPAQRSGSSISRYPVRLTQPWQPQPRCSVPSQSSWKPPCRWAAELSGSPALATSPQPPAQMPGRISLTRYCPPSRCLHYMWCMAVLRRSLWLNSF